MVYLPHTYSVLIADIWTLGEIIYCRAQINMY